MDTKFLKSKYRKNIIFFSVVAIFMIVFLVVATTVFFNSGPSNWIETNCEIISIINETVTIAFNVGGQIITGRSNVYSSTMKEGDILRVKYNPNDPKEFSVMMSTDIKLLFTIPEIVVIAVMSVLIIINIVKLVKVKDTNVIVEAKVNGPTNKNEGINNSSPFINNSIKTRSTAFGALPVSMFEYKKLDETNRALYRFRINKDDGSNYLTEDKGKNILYKTELLTQNKYKIIDVNNTNKTNVVLIENIQLANSSQKEESFSIKINNKDLKEYFLERRIKFEFEEGEKGLIYKLINNENIFAEIYEIVYDENSSDDSNERMFVILSNKESIDDASLFSLCIAKRKNHEIGRVEVKK